MKILAGVAWAIFAGVQVLEGYWFARPERHRVKISDMAQRMDAGLQGTGLPRWKFVRGAWAFWALMSFIAVAIIPELIHFWLGADVPATQPPAGTGTPLSTAGLILLLLPFAIVVALAVMLLVVMNTGRPRFLVLKPCRGMAPDEIEAWLAPRINLFAWKREPEL